MLKCILIVLSLSAASLSSAASLERASDGRLQLSYSCLMIADANASEIQTLAIANREIYSRNSKGRFTQGAS